MFKAGRNDPCPCGSGKKFKKCHGIGGTKKFVATVLAKDSKNLVNKINSVTNEISSSGYSLKNRVSFNSNSQNLDKAGDQKDVEDKNTKEKEENFNL